METAYSKFRLATKYVRYYFTSANGKGHGIHSPFVYDFITNVLNDRRHFYAYSKIEILREALLHDTRQLEIQDYGAGSAFGKKNRSTVANIAKLAVKPRKFGQLLFRIANYYQPRVMLELGTSLGVTTAYLAMSNLSAKVFSCEGSCSIAKVAKENFIFLGLDNIEQKKGDFDQILPPLLHAVTGLDFAFIDGNHRKEPTVRYFNQLLDTLNENAVLIFDDIHWSRDMEQAWKEIKDDPKVLLTIDLFFVGLVFFRKDFKVKQHFTIRF